MATTSQRVYRPTEFGMMIVLGRLGSVLVSVLTGSWWVLPFGLPVGIALGLGVGAAVEARRDPPVGRPPPRDSRPPSL